MQNFEGCDLKKSMFFDFRKRRGFKIFLEQHPRLPSIPLLSLLAPSIITPHECLWVGHGPLSRQKQFGRSSTESLSLEQTPPNENFSRF